jgi:hypothetical protein
MHHCHFRRASILKTLVSKLRTPKSKAYRQLAADLAGYSLVPYGWVLYARPWSEGQLTEFNGQDKWQCGQLEAICAKLRSGDRREEAETDLRCQARTVLRGRSNEAILTTVRPPEKILSSPAFCRFYYLFNCRFWLPLLVAVLQGQIPAWYAVAIKTN